MRLICAEKAANRLGRLPQLWAGWEGDPPLWLWLDTGVFIPSLIGLVGTPGLLWFSFTAELQHFSDMEVELSQV